MPTRDREPRVACRAEFNGKGSCKWGTGCRFAHTDAEVGLPLEEVRANRNPVAGFVFLCDDKTRGEVLKLRCFGLPKKNFEEMQTIDDTTQLFLWNFRSTQLMGPFSADGKPALNVEPSAFNGRFPAQLRFKGTGKMCSSKKRYKVGPLDSNEVATALEALGVTSEVAEDPDAKSRRRKTVDVDDNHAPGWMYVVNNDSQSEVLRKRLIAVREARLDLLQARISPNTSIFLYNHNTRTLLGIFQSRGTPALDIDPDAFGGRFRAQMKVGLDTKTLQQCRDDKQYDGGPLTVEEVLTLSEALHRPVDD